MPRLRRLLDSTAGVLVITLSIVMSLLPIAGAILVFGGWL